MTETLHKYRYWWPLLVLVVFAPFSKYIDLSAAHFCYVDGNFHSNAFFDFMKNYGCLPALFIGIAATLAWIACASWLRRWKQYCGPAAVLSLTLIIGPGILANVLLKDHWGRPRPRQLEQFGGTESYRPFYSPNFIWKCNDYKSFPSGHVTMGFYFFALAWLGRRHGRPTLIWGGTLAALLLGTALAATRVTQGGHFVSDALASAILMWYTVELVGACVYRGFGIGHMREQGVVGSDARTNKTSKGSR